MTISAIRTGALSAAFALANLAGAPLFAQDAEEMAFAEIDALSDATVDEQAGIQTARDQAARGEYLEALATLERVLAKHPKSNEAKLIHAVYLCRIDDGQGGLVEIDKLKEKEVGKQTLDDARTMCTGRGQ